MIYAKVHSYSDNELTQKYTVMSKFTQDDSTWIAYDVPDNDWLYLDANNSIQTHTITEMNAPVIAKAKTDQITLLTNAYETAITSDVSYLSTTFQADVASQDLITKVITSLGGVTPAGFVWFDKNNNAVPMTCTELVGLASTIVLRAQPLFIKLQTLKANVRAATDVPSITSVVW